MRIITKYRAKPQHGITLEKMLQELITPTRRARGCVRYDLHRSLDLQLVFFADQLWESKENWQVFMSSKEMQKFDALIEGILDEYDQCFAD